MAGLALESLESVGSRASLPPVRDYPVKALSCLYNMFFVLGIFPVLLRGKLFSFVRVVRGKFFRERERIWEKARHDEAQALENAEKRQEERGEKRSDKKWQSVVADKDAEIERLRKLITWFQVLHKAKHPAIYLDFLGSSLNQLGNSIFKPRLPDKS
jgi:hypothetical protein